MADDNWRNTKRNIGGSICKKGKYIYARVQYVDKNGQRKEIYRRAENRTHARRLIKQIREELETPGFDSNSSRMTVSQLIEEYSDSRVQPAKFVDGRKVSGKRSIAPVRSALKVIRASLGRRLIRELAPRDIERFKEERFSTPTIHGNQRKPASVNRELEVLRAMLNFSFENGWINESPFSRLRSKSVISKASEVERDRILSPEEELGLLGACEGRRSHLKPIVITALDTAMRRGELLQLTWHDIDFVSRTITIQAQNSKTEKTRFVPLTNRTYESLTDLEAASLSGNDLVFGIKSTFKNAWKSACASAAIEDLTFHDLRHTATTRMILAGISHTEVMKITGHTQMKTFLRYLNLKRDHLSNVASQLDSYNQSSSTADAETKSALAN